MQFNVVTQDFFRVSVAGLSTRYDSRAFSIRSRTLHTLLVSAMGLYELQSDVSLSGFGRGEIRALRQLAGTTPETQDRFRQVHPLTDQHADDGPT